MDLKRRGEVWYTLTLCRSVSSAIRALLVASQKLGEAILILFVG